MGTYSDPRAALTDRGKIIGDDAILSGAAAPYAGTAGSDRSRGSLLYKGGGERLRGFDRSAPPAGPRSYRKSNRAAATSSARRPGGWWVLPGPGIELPRAPEVSPDVGGWRRERMPAPPAEGDPLRLAPDWVCEVLSPSNRRWDIKKKFPFYARLGVPWLWVVDPPARTISVRHLVNGAWTIVVETEGDDAAALEPFAAVELPLGRLWIPSTP